MFLYIDATGPHPVNTQSLRFCGLAVSGARFSQCNTLPAERSNMQSNAQDRRMMRRFDMRLPAIVRLEGADEVRTETQNVSARGVFFYLDRPVSAGTGWKLLSPSHLTSLSPTPSASASPPASSASKILSHRHASAPPPSSKTTNSSAPTAAQTSSPPCKRNGKPQTEFELKCGADTPVRRRWCWRWVFLLR